MIQEFLDEIEGTVRGLIGEVHTALPGKIISVNAAKGLAKVEPIGKWMASDGEYLDYPQISDVPIVFPYCSTEKVGITYPVKKGDSCLIIISEVELDKWRTGAEAEGPLKHDLSNAIVIPGLMKSGQTLPESNSKKSIIIAADKTKLSVSKSEKSIEMVSGGTKVTVNTSGITAKGNTSVTGQVSITGNVSVNGNITCSGTVSWPH